MPCPGRADLHRHRAFKRKRLSTKLTSLGVIVLVAYAPALSAGMPFGDMGQRESDAVKPAARRSVFEGVYSAEQAQKGKVLYGNRCAKCHGENLGGDRAPALSGPYFFERWDSVGDVLQLAQKTMPQDEPASLTPQEYVDIVSYVLSFNGLPAGQTNLPPDPDKLKSIKIEQEASPR